MTFFIIFMDHDSSAEIITGRGMHTGSVVNLGFEADLTESFTAKLFYKVHVWCARMEHSGVHLCGVK